MAKKFNYLIVMVFFLASTATVFAQGNEELPEAPPQAPINDHIVLLVAAGSFLAWKYYHKRATRSQND